MRAALLVAWLALGCVSAPTVRPGPPGRPEAVAVAAWVTNVLENLYDAHAAWGREFAFVLYGIQTGYRGVYFVELCIPQQLTLRSEVVPVWETCPVREDRLAWGHSHIEGTCKLSPDDLKLLAQRPEPYTVLACRIREGETPWIAPDGAFVLSLAAKAP